MAKSFIGVVKSRALTMLLSSDMLSQASFRFNFILIVSPEMLTSASRFQSSRSAFYKQKEMTERFKKSETRCKDNK